MTKQYEYGTTVVEFFKHSEEDFKELLSKRLYEYNGRSEGLYYRGRAACVDWLRYMPLELALIELQDDLKNGYTLIKAESSSLYFKAILRKPEKFIKSETVELEKLARDEYDQSRYERNVAETARQVEISVSRERRQAEEAAAAAAKAAADEQQETQEQKALADLLRAYGKPVEVAA